MTRASVVPFSLPGDGRTCGRGTRRARAMYALLRVDSAHSFRPPPKFVDGRFGPHLAALRARPRLRLADERPQLVEEARPRAVIAVERLDPLEPCRDLRRFVHEDDRSGRRVTCL